MREKSKQRKFFIYKHFRSQVAFAFTFLTMASLANILLKLKINRINIC